MEERPPQTPLTLGKLLQKLPTNYPPPPKKKNKKKHTCWPVKMWSQEIWIFRMPPRWRNTPWIKQQKVSNAWQMTVIILWEAKHPINLESSSGVGFWFKQKRIYNLYNIILPFSSWPPLKKCNISASSSSSIHIRLRPKTSGLGWQRHRPAPRGTF